MIAPVANGKLTETRVAGELNRDRRSELENRSIGLLDFSSRILIAIDEIQPGIRKFPRWRRENHIHQRAILCGPTPLGVRTAPARTLFVHECHCACRNIVHPPDDVDFTLGLHFAEQSAPLFNRRHGTLNVFGRNSIDEDIVL